MPTCIRHACGQVSPPPPKLIYQSLVDSSNSLLVRHLPFCLSVHRGDCVPLGPAGIHPLGKHRPGPTPPRQTTPPWADALGQTLPPSETAYWNAFLLVKYPVCSNLCEELCGSIKLFKGTNSLAFIPIDLLNILGRQ